ncbi:hypothetical protein H0O01_05405 [Candidatus Micrarchaeota archaeon]|nr:hypothetical protein [Candidatus Micrarchaeota archaeon]
MLHGKEIIAGGNRTNCENNIPAPPPRHRLLSAVLVAAAVLLPSCKTSNQAPETTKPDVTMQALGKVAAVPYATAQPSGETTADANDLPIEMANSGGSCGEDRRCHFMELSKRAFTETTGSGLEGMVITFRGALSDPDPVVRYLAVTGLYRVAKNKPELISAEELAGILEMASRDEDNTVRLVAGYFLGAPVEQPAHPQPLQERGASLSSRIAALERDLYGRDENASYYALNQLLEIVTDGQTDVKSLKKIVEIARGAWRSRNWSRDYPPVGESIPSHILTYELLRQKAVFELCRNSTADEAVTILGNALADPSLRYDRHELVRELLDIFESGETSLPVRERILGVLERTLKDNNLLVRSTIVYGINYHGFSQPLDDQHLMEKVISMLMRTYNIWTERSRDFRYPECLSNSPCQDDSYNAELLRATVLSLISEFRSF